MTSSVPDALRRDGIVDFIEEVFTRRGGEEYLGEPVTMAEHMLQGAHFAERAGEPDTVVVAALLHDIGHFTSEFGTFSMADTEDRLHEEAGARVLEPFFPALVIDCIRRHVPAKRYLCAVEPAYLDALSDASRHSLRLQGGPMTAAEVHAFERNRHLDEIVRVRRYDDRGKVAHLAVPAFAHHLPAIRRVVDAHGAATGHAEGDR